MLKDMFFTVRLTASDRKRLDALASALGQRRGNAVRFLIQEAARHIPSPTEDRNVSQLRGR
jgi:predicted DNA-binding protein